MLKVGDKIPILKGINQDGKELLINDFEGDKLIVFIYPKDSTPGCTMEACNLRDNYELLMSKGFSIIGISADSAKRHQNFIIKNQLPFNLIADESKDILNSFGVWGPKKFMGKEYEGIHRTTFVVDKGGVVERVFEKVKTKDHTNQILKSY
tara:strand:- start:744 stop:1196 length:453 start_codon:yes stop_codon:yes gene_type:complete